jgi:CHASE1-domain containing sensor protein
MPNVTHANRAFAEEEARGYYAENYEHVNYRGFTGFEPSPETGEVGLNPRSEQPFYFPVHLVEPVTGNEAALDLDLYSSQIQKETLLQAIRTWRPALTDRLKLVQDPDPTAYSVILHHPGVNTTIHPGETATGVSLMVVRVPDLIARATSTHQEGRSVFIFDSTYTEEAPNFLGGADTDMNNYSVREETTLQHLQDSSDRIEVGKVRIADREWTIAVLPLDGTFEANFLFVSLGGCIIFAACLILVVWFYTSMRRSAKITQMMAKAETEKAAIIIETAKQQATSERELNGTCRGRKPSTDEGTMTHWIKLLLHGKTSLHTK